MVWILRAPLRSSDADDDSTESITAPLLTAFIPSLRAGEPFQISLHSWKPRPFNFRPAGNPRPDRPQVWQFKVTVDGQVKCVDTMTADVQWPKALHLATAQVGPNGQPDQLRFPPFYQESVYANKWHPYAEMGRIKVEISEGFLERTDRDAKFVKLTVHVIFNFQHAPMGESEHSRSLWANKVQDTWLTLRRCSPSLRQSLAKSGNVEGEARLGSSSHARHAG